MGAMVTTDAVTGETLATRYDVALLDLDGVVYVGDHGVPGAAAGIAAARSAGMRVAFVTNNAGRPPEAVAEHLSALGIPAATDDVVTSAQAGAHLLSGRLEPGSRVLAIGGPGVPLAIERAGLAPVRPGEQAALEVAAVLQGFGSDVAWADLAAAALAVQRGATWILTNPDLTLPLPDGPVPGNGSLARAVESAAGRSPDAIAGKPHPALMEASIERTDARAPLVVGDRLDTDIAGAACTGIASLLVLTGICDVAGALMARQGERPDYLGLDLTALTATPAATGGGDGPRVEAGTWRRGSAQAWVADGELHVECGDEWLAALQCGCAAAWAEEVPPRVAAAAAQLERARRTVVP
jgi:glycerol 3-phosphatase-2